MTVQRTFNSDESMTLAATTAIELIGEMYHQSLQGFIYVDNTLVNKTPFNPFFKVSVKRGIEHSEPDVTVHRIDFPDNVTWLNSPNGESLLRVLSKVFSKQEDGKDITTDSVTMAFGSFNAKLKGLSEAACEDVPDELVSTDEGDVEPLFQGQKSTPEDFDLNLAMVQDDKASLVAYVSKYGIELDKRRNLTSMKNQLQTILNAGQNNG